jgi:tetratricopeptide (TPR) repeat protein
MKISDVPNISAEMDRLYEKYFEADANATAILPLIDDFLSKHPTYPEALVFKARMLMVIGRNGEALRCLKAAQKIDRWLLVGRFDQAEIYLKKNKPEVALEIYINAVKAYASELSDGLDEFLSSCNNESKSIIKRKTKEALTKYLTGEQDSAVFDDLLKTLKKRAKKLEHYENVEPPNQRDAK